MATEQTISAQIKNRDGKQAPGQVRVQTWTAQDRLKRSLKALGLCWGGAIVAVFMPLIHFVLVPSLLLAGPIVAYVFYQSESVVLGGEGHCPSCQKPFKIVRQKNKWPLKDICSSCQSEVEIVTSN